MLTFVYGTRPEAIKLGPVVADLRALGVPFHVICTSQHTDLLRGTPAETDLAFAQSLDLPSDGTVTLWMRHAIPVIRSALREVGATIVVVQGDTMSACAGARAAREEGLLIAHIEAGVRSWSDYEPFPEEQIRRDITRIADVHFAATVHAMDNLRREGIHPAKVFLTGNPVVSAIQRYTGASPVPIPERRIVITLHRRELVQSGRFTKVVDAVRDAATQVSADIIWPLHPGTAALVRSRGDVPANLTIGDPLPYREFTQLVAGSLGVLTDSGGLTEECATLGVPCAVFRAVTDRPEAVEAGVARVFEPTPENVLPALQCLMNQEIPRLPLPLYGTPSSAFKIAQHLGRLVGKETLTPSLVGN